MDSGNTRYDISAIQNAISNLETTLDEMRGLQKLLSSKMNEFSETWKSSVSAASFNKLENFLGMSNDSQLSRVLQNIERDVDNLQSTIPYLTRLDEQGIQ